MIGMDVVGLNHAPAPVLSEIKIHAAAGQKTKAVVVVEAIGRQPVPSSQQFNKGRNVLTADGHLGTERYGVHISVIGMGGAEQAAPVAAEVSAKICGQSEPAIHVVSQGRP